MTAMFRLNRRLFTSRIPATLSLTVLPSRAAEPLDTSAEEPGLQRRLSDLQSDNIAEVISSLHAHPTEDKMMEVLLVQGPAPKLQLARSLPT